MIEKSYVNSFKLLLHKIVKENQQHALSLFLSYQNAALKDVLEIWIFTL